MHESHTELQHDHLFHHGDSDARKRISAVIILNALTMAAEIIAAAQPYTFLFVARWTALLDKRIVRQVLDENGNPVYLPIVPTKTGRYTYHLNQWIKLATRPTLADRG